MLVCDLCLLNPAVLVVSGLSDVLGAIGRILLSYLVHMHNSLRSLRQEQVHVGPITWEVLPHWPGHRTVSGAPLAAPMLVFAPNFVEFPIYFLRWFMLSFMHLR
jgi:hypothetical protein